MKKFSDLDQVRQALTEAMDLDEFIRLADKKYSAETGRPINPIEMVNDHLYKKQCDLDTHPTRMAQEIARHHSLSVRQRKCGTASDVVLVATDLST